MLKKIDGNDNGITHLGIHLVQVSRILPPTMLSFLPFQRSKLIFLLVLFAFASQARERVVVYSWPKSMQSDKRGDYPVALLQLALLKSGMPIRSAASDFVMSQHRTLKQLESNKGIDVVWTMTNPLREAQLRPIRIPIDRGLIGWRLLAIRQQDANLFQQLPSAQALRTLLTVQGSDWPDYLILQGNGFKVTPSQHFDGMYAMLSGGRVQYFARSATEIWLELAAENTRAATLQVAPRWVLHYPAALYFFVRKQDDELARAIESGLETAIADGSMNQLFLQHFQQVIEQSAFEQREIIELHNAELPSETPLQRPELWFDPKKGY